MALIVAVLACLSAVFAVSPIVVEPSYSWSGDDGKWSTFFVGIGSPAQSLRLLPGTSAESSTVFWVIIPEGCVNVNPSLATCADDRGALFTQNASTSWSTQGLENHADGAIYTLNTVEEANVGLVGNGSYGYDTVSLGVGKSGLPVLQNQLIAGIWTDDFFLGVLPLSPLPFNFSFSEPQTSMLGTLRNQSLIPSLSWAYTAGAWYQDARTSHYGSLVLGGYDASRFESNNVVFSFGSDVSRDLLLQLRSITYDTLSSQPLLTSTINIFIDSVISDIWLPTSVCEAFAKAFNLTYNTQGNYYLVSNASHDALLRQNPTFTLTLSNGSSNVEIAMPYAAFDLNLTEPITGDNRRYFPIRRGQNESQYVLGRTFLQEAYVVADYERRQFSVSQAIFPSTSVSQNIIAIELPGGQGGRGLSVGAIVGIVIGIVLIVILTLIVVLVVLRRKRRKTAEHHQFFDHNLDPDHKESVEGEARTMHEKGGAQTELLTGANAHEMSGLNRPHELSAKPHAYELPTPPREPIELEAH